MKYGRIKGKSCRPLDCNDGPLSLGQGSIRTRRNAFHCLSNGLSKEWTKALFLASIGRLDGQCELQGFSFLTFLSASLWPTFIQ